MTGLARGFVSELRLLATGRRYRIMLVLFAGATWLTAETYHTRVVRDLPVAVVDLDGGRLARTARLWLEATPELSTAGAPPSSVEEARARLVDGSLAAVFVIPSDFSARVKKGEPGEVVVGVDMSNVLVGRTAQRAAARVLGTLGAGVTLTTLERLGERPGEALAHVAPVTLDDTPAFNPTASFATYLVPAYAYFFLHILTLFVGWSVLSGRRGAARPGRVELAGGLAAVLVVTLALGLALTYGLLPREGVIPASSPAVVIAALLAFLALDLLVAAAIAAVVPVELLALQLTALLGMLSLVLSGLTWPTDAFPPALRGLSAAIPLTPFGRSSRLFLLERSSLGDLAPVWRQLGAQAALWGALLVLGALVRARGLGPWRRT